MEQNAIYEENEIMLSKNNFDDIGVPRIIIRVILALGQKRIYRFLEYLSNFVETRTICA